MVVTQKMSHLNDFLLKKLAKNNEILMKKGADFGAIERCHRKAIAGQNALCGGGGN